jgi:hypothetical protein
LRLSCRPTIKGVIRFLERVEREHADTVNACPMLSNWTSATTPRIISR